MSFNSGSTNGNQAEALRKQVGSCASWFFWIAALTGINSAMLLTGSDTSFFMGLTVAQLADVIAGGAGSMGKIVAGIFDAACIGFFVLLGLKARKGQRWAFIVGLILYGMDTLISLIAPHAISIALHAWALLMMGMGLKHAGNLAAAEAEAALPPVIDPALAPAPAAVTPVGWMQSRQLDKAADELEKMARVIYAPSHRYGAVDPRTYRALDLKFYDTALARVEELGFRHLIDEENLDTKGTAQDPGCFTRVALSADGTVMSAFYQMRPRLWLRILLRLSGTKLGKATDFETEFSDGTFLCTTNAELAASAKSPVQILNAFLPWETPVQKVYECHLQRLQAHLGAHPELAPRVLHGLDDVHASQARQQGLKSVFKKNVGTVSREELLANANTPAQVEVAEQLWQRIEERRRGTATATATPSPA